ncbi:hypothetical protein IV203_014833 [Nitzschia inconspicua]|uniref:Uncharacterized protein n=1 Tax=Nitzschia inconspicua TaxID=303405 RepID=A0A9K3LCN7_9STRA|nr:hypothetical protein IV203_014833 [Nitzschia inconspicua]
MFSIKDNMCSASAYDLPPTLLKTITPPRGPFPPLMLKSQKRRKAQEWASLDDTSPQRTGVLTMCYMTNSLPPNSMALKLQAQCMLTSDIPGVLMQAETDGLLQYKLDLTILEVLLQTKPYDDACIADKLIMKTRRRCP